MNEIVNKILYYKSDVLNPYVNLALEAYFLKTVKEGQLIVYLWSNDKTVVIGRNQDAFSEVNLAALELDSGFLARRYTGGGAVYHDKNNLNFSFITLHEGFNAKKQTKAILNAVSEYGISPTLSGRNDLICGGKKFSGNAYLKTDRASLHHGTLLLDTDLDAMQRYLAVSSGKMAKKGVKSVQSRVVNLSELCCVDKDGLCDKIINSVCVEYGVAATRLLYENIDLKLVEDEEIKLKSADWLYGKSTSGLDKIEGDFGFGNAVIYFQICCGNIEYIKVVSDTLLVEELCEAERLLSGQKLAALRRIDSEIYRQIVAVIGGVYE